MGLQMRIELEPLDADLDGLIDAYAALPWQERARRLPYCLEDLDGHFAGVPLVVTGAGAAALPQLPIDQVRVTLVEPPPGAVTVTVDDAKVPVLPLHDIELTDSEAARLLERARERRRAIS